MAEHGGYRKPTNPAPASGPGKLSKRTDGGPGHASQKLMVPSGMPYGDRQGLMDQERTAAMSQSDSIHPANVPAQPGQAPSGPPAAGHNGPPFGAPTQRPDEPVTHGVDIGPGGGTDVLPDGPAGVQQRGSGAVANMLRTLSATDVSGDIATLYQAALTRGV